MNTYTADIHGKTVTFTHLGSNDQPPFELVTSVLVVPFLSDGRMVAVRLSHRGIDLPGGHVEPGETTPEETMQREVMEEACVTIRDWVLVEIIKSDFFDDRPSYMLLYGAYVDEIYEYVPEEKAIERVILEPTEFIERYEAGDKRLMGKAIKLAWEKLNSTPQSKI